MQTETKKTIDQGQIEAEETLNEFVEKLRTKGIPGRLVQLVLEAILFWESPDCAKVEGETCAQYVGKEVTELQELLNRGRNTPTRFKLTEKQAHKIFAGFPQVMQDSPRFTSCYPALTGEYGKRFSRGKVLKQLRENTEGVNLNSLVS